MPKIIQLSSHVANLIAAGEVVERPASVVKELLENAVDAGASHVTVEIRDGGMTFLRVTDNGCGMTPEDAPTAFLRHATSKLRTADDLSAIGTMGFRGEALAAIASVSRIELLTKTPSNISGTSLHLEAGVITEDTEAGCPDGTTIIIRDLFFNTPARMKFMKTDTVEAGKVSAAVQLQALAHPEVSFHYIRDGKQVLSTPGTGELDAAVYSVYGRESAKMIKVDSRWEGYRLTGYVTRPSDARPSRAMQTFFVNDRPVKSKLLIAALEEAYRNQIMVGKFPACVLHLHIPASMLDVNVHPAKTEVKFLSEKAVFDCVHYGILGALNKASDRPQLQFRETPAAANPKSGSASSPAPKQETFFRTMNAEDYKAFSAAMQNAPQPKSEAAAATLAAQKRDMPLRETVQLPTMPEANPITATSSPSPICENQEPVAEQTVLPMPQEIPWRYVGELYNSYIIVEQGDDAFLIDKHAAHERILFNKLKANQESISSQSLLTPIVCHFKPDICAELMVNTTLMEELGFEIDSLGDNTILLRQIPMELSPADAQEAVEMLAMDLLNGRKEDKNQIRDAVLHTVACKAAIKAGWHTDEAELRALVNQVMENHELKHCPHGRPICISLSKKQLEKQFKRA